MQTPEPYPTPEYEDDWLDEEPAPRPARPAAQFWGWGGTLTWVAGLVLALSAFMGWYAGGGEGVTVAVIGWHTGALAKIVLVIGLLVIALHLLHQAGIELPATVPESLIVIVLGSLATILVLIRLISIPEEFQPASRGIGIWISLVAAVLVIVAGLLRASEDL